MIGKREMSSVELVNAQLEQIERINPALNAAVQVMAESARKQAARADAQLAAGGPCGPLHGVPFSVKDSVDVEGTRCTAGTLGRRNAAVADRDAALVQRLRAAGGIPIAKTNLPDLLFSFETDNLIYGRTNNPYDLTRTPGGSSGGEAALIAACGSPLGLGSDCAGSVRVPAAFCGITSITPTAGRVPTTTGGQTGDLHDPRTQIGLLARRVDDLCLALPLICGPDGFDASVAPVPLGDPDAVDLAAL